jgi:photosystem II stability/assembly factor-like uncharacterized protein
MKKLILVSILLFNTAFAQWKLSSFKAATSLHEVAFPSSNAAYAVGDLGTLYKSVDEGVHWTQHYDFGPFVIATDLFFMNADTGFVNIYGMQYRSFDGGSTWNQYADFPKVKPWKHDLFTSYSSNDTSYILKSTDYGNTWQLLYSNYTVNNEAFVFSIINPQYAFFIQPTQLDKVYKTIDGFTSIDTIQITTGDIELQDEFEYKDLEHGYHYGSFGSKSSPSRTWNTGSFYFPIDLDGFGVLPVLDLELNTNKLFASSLYGKIFYSTDMGNTWTEQQTELNKPIYSISFLNDTRGIAISDNQILYTTNGGTNSINTELNSSTVFNIYPSYFEDIIVVESPVSEKKTITIYNITGQILTNIISSESKSEINLTHLQSGMYIIDIATEKSHYTQKIFKE